MSFSKMPGGGYGWFLNIGNFSQPLRAAAASGDLGEVKRLCESGLDPNESGPGSRKTALHQAVNGGHVEVVGYLISQGATFFPDRGGKFPFAYATTDKMRQSLRPLGSKVSWDHLRTFFKDDLFYTLHMAVEDSQLPMIKTILDFFDKQTNEKIVDVNTRIREAGSSIDNVFTLLYVAVKLGNIPIIECLIEHGAILLEDDNGKLNRLAGNNKVVQDLLVKRFKIIIIQRFEDASTFPPEANMKDDYGPLIVRLNKDKSLPSDERLSLRDFQELLAKYNNPAVVQGYPTLCIVAMNSDKWEERVSYLLDLGFDPDLQIFDFVPNGYQDTPLHIMLVNETLQMAGNFIRLVNGKGKFLDVARQDSNHKTTLHMAAMLGAIEVVKLLFRQPSGPRAIDIQDKKGRTALHWAYLLGREDVVSFLKQNRASEEIRDNEDYTPSDILASENLPRRIEEELAEFHIKRKEEITKCLCGSLNLQKQLMPQQAQEQAAASQTQTAQQMIFGDKSKSLRTAAAKGNLGEVTRLCDSRLDINEAGPVSGKTALHQAVIEGHEAVVRYLVSQGAKFLPDKNGQYPLDYATTEEMRAALNPQEKEGLRPVEPNSSKSYLNSVRR